MTYLENIFSRLYIVKNRIIYAQLKGSHGMLLEGEPQNNNRKPLGRSKAQRARIKTKMPLEKTKVVIALSPVSYCCSLKMFFFFILFKPHKKQRKSVINPD